MRRESGLEVRCPAGRGGVRLLACLVGCAVLVVTSGCASLTIEKRTLTEGRLIARARSFNLLFMHLPRDPSHEVLELVADAPVVDIRQHQLTSSPDLWWPFSWINLFLGYSQATCTANCGLPAPGAAHPAEGQEPSP